MIKILKAYGIPDIIVHTIEDTYQGTKAKVITSDGDTVEFDILAGVLQGDTLAPYLFIITRNQFDMYSFVSQSWCAVWQKNDMLLKWSIVKSTSEPKPQRKAHHLKDTLLLCDF